MEEPSGTPEARGNHDHGSNREVCEEAQGEPGEMHASALLTNHHRTTATANSRTAKILASVYNKPAGTASGSNSSRATPTGMAPK